MTEQERSDLIGALVSAETARRESMGVIGALHFESRVLYNELDGLAELQREALNALISESGDLEAIYKLRERIVSIQGGLVKMQDGIVAVGGQVENHAPILDQFLLDLPARPEPEPENPEEGEEV